MVTRHGRQTARRKGWSTLELDRQTTGRHMIIKYGGFLKFGYLNSWMVLNSKVKLKWMIYDVKSQIKVDDLG